MCKNHNEPGLILENSSQRVDCLVFVTHMINEDIIRYLRYLREETKSLMDLVVLYDCSSQEINPSDYSEFNFQFFNSKYLTSFFHQNNKLLPNPLIVLIEYSRRCEYNHFLLIENDIILITGGFNNNPLVKSTDFIKIEQI